MKAKTTADNMLPVHNPHINGSYHVSWANRGCVWRLISKDETHAVMQTPKTKKQITVKLSDLRHTRSAQEKILNK